MLSPSSAIKFREGFNVVQAGGFRDFPNSSLIFNTKWIRQHGWICSITLGSKCTFPIGGSPSCELVGFRVSYCNQLSDKTIVHSARTWKLGISWLPNKVTEVHIVQNLVDSSLIWTRQFANVGCKVVSDELYFRLLYTYKLLFTSGKDSKTTMWELPSNKIGKHNSNSYWFSISKWDVMTFIKYIVYTPIHTITVHGN